MTNKHVPLAEKNEIYCAIHNICNFIAGNDSTLTEDERKELYDMTERLMKFIDENNIESSPQEIVAEIKDNLEDDNQVAMERLENTLQEMSVKYKYKKNENSDDWYGIVEFWTDTSGQDIPTEFDFDGTAKDFVKKFCEAADNYDVDEEVEIFANMRGKQGVPNTIKELLEDMQEAKDTLMEISEKLKLAIDDKYLESYVLDCLAPMIINNSNLENAEDPTMRGIKDIEKTKHSIMLDFENDRTAFIDVKIY